MYFVRLSFASAPRLVLHACDLLLAVYEHLAIRGFSLYARLTDSLQRVSQLQRAFASSLAASASSSTSGRTTPPGKRRSTSSSQEEKDEEVLEDLKAGRKKVSSSSSSLALMDRPDKDISTNGEDEERKERRRSSEEADCPLKKEGQARRRAKEAGEERDRKLSERRDAEVEEIDLLSSSSPEKQPIEDRNEKRRKEELKHAIEVEREKARHISRVLHKTLVRRQKKVFSYLHARHRETPEGGMTIGRRIKK